MEVSSHCALGNLLLILIINDLPHKIKLCAKVGLKDHIKEN